jgi:translation initiation factor IF-1
MAKKKNQIIEGEVTESLPNTMFKVELEDGREVLTTLKGKLRRSYVKILPGVRVKVEMTPYDDKRGRIIQKVR